MKNEAKLKTASTFSDVQSAQHVITGAFRQNRNQIRQWLRNSHVGQTQGFGYVGDPQVVVGRVLSKGSSSAVPSWNGRVVLKKVSERRYIVYTAFPQP